MRVEQTYTFRKWLDGLEDRAGRARVLVRIDRLIGGNPGPHRQLAGGVSELKIDVGPGLSRLLRAARFDAAPPAGRR